MFHHVSLLYISHFSILFSMMSFMVHGAIAGSHAATNPEKLVLICSAIQAYLWGFSTIWDLGMAHTYGSQRILKTCKIRWVDTMDELFVVGNLWW